MEKCRYFFNNWCRLATSLSEKFRCEGQKEKCQKVNVLEKRKEWETAFIEEKAEEAKPS